MREATLILITAAVMLAGCSRSLGEYAFEDAKSVDASELTNIDSSATARENGGNILKITLSSKVNLEEASDGTGDVYVNASACPFDDENPDYLAGPFYGSKERYQITQTLQSVDEQGRRTIISESTPNPIPVDNATGRFLYTVYLDPTRSDWQQLTDPNARAQKKVCIRFHSTHMLSLPRKSEIIEIDANSLFGLLDTDA